VLCTSRRATVLVINVTVICEVRRASNNAAVNLGLQQHHQSTSSNSAVPTVMLITTSLLYVLLTVPASILYVVIAHIPDSVWCSVTWRRTLNIVIQSRMVSAGLYHVVFACNFFVYLITGKQFRSELCQLWLYQPLYSYNFFVYLITGKQFRSELCQLCLYQPLYSYNFFVYLITGKQFRSELRQLCSSCSSSNNNEPAIAVRTPPHGQAVTNV